MSKEFLSINKTKYFWTIIFVLFLFGLNFVNPAKASTEIYGQTFNYLCSGGSGTRCALQLIGSIGKPCENEFGRKDDSMCKPKTNKPICSRGKCILGPATAGKSCATVGDNAICAHEDGKCGGPFAPAEQPPAEDKLCKSSGGHSPVYSTDGLEWRWSCFPVGTGGTVDASCHTPKKSAPGECGGPFEPSEKPPTLDKLCKNNGWASVINSDDPYYWTWDCNPSGLDNSKPAFCKAPKKKIDGFCGKDNGFVFTPTAEALQPPSSGNQLCKQGTDFNSAIGKTSLMSIGKTKTWEWYCFGQAGGVDAPCKTLPPESTNGKCGAFIQGKTFENLTADNENLCDIGLSSDFELSNDVRWKWNCIGTGAGTSALCYAWKKELLNMCGPAVNKVIDSTVCTHFAIGTIADELCNPGYTPWQNQFFYDKHYCAWECTTNLGPPVQQCHSQVVLGPNCGRAITKEYASGTLSVPVDDACSGEELTYYVDDEKNLVFDSNTVKWTCKSNIGGADSELCTASRKPGQYDAACGIFKNYPAGTGAVPAIHACNSVSHPDNSAKLKFVKDYASWICVSNLGGKSSDTCEARQSSSSTCDARTACSNHGTCSVPVTGGTAINIFNGFIGSILNSYLSQVYNQLFAVTTPSACSCSSCKCDNGWTGKNCSTPTTCTPTCYSSIAWATCQPGTTQTGSCASTNCGTTQYIISTRPCPPVSTCNSAADCNGRGTCKVDGTCDCGNSGYTGTNCETLIAGNCSALGECNNHGVCAAGDTCSCDAGWALPDCSKEICTSWTYNAWTPATCPSSGAQTRTIATRTPTGCTGGTPEALSRTCTHGSVVNGTCGTADDKIYPQSATGFGGDTACSAGTPSPNPVFPTAGNSVEWKCIGSSGSGPWCMASHCNPATDCNGHGNCNATSAESSWCTCNTGWNTSVSCADCATDYYPTVFYASSSANACVVRCTPTTCGDHGYCNYATPTTSQPCTCLEGWAGSTCNVCATNYYPVVGSCVYCNPETTCNSHGACNPNPADIYNMCYQCDTDWIGGDCGTPQPYNCNTQTWQCTACTSGMCVFGDKAQCQGYCVPF